MNIVSENIIDDFNNNINKMNNIITKITRGINRENIIHNLLSNNIWNIVLIQDNEKKGIIINNEKKLFLELYNPNKDYKNFKNIKFISLNKNSDYIDQDNKSFTDIFLKLLINIYEQNDNIFTLINEKELVSSYNIFINSNNNNNNKHKLLVMSHNELKLFSKLNENYNDLHTFIISYYDFLSYLEKKNKENIIVYSSEESLNSDSELDSDTELNSNDEFNIFTNNHNVKINNLLSNNLLPNDILNLLKINNNFNDINIKENSDFDIITDSELTTITEL